jgi:pyrimidine deaminase RibD-like protein
MRQAIDLARQATSEPGKISPRVGAVVVRDDGTLLGGAYRGELDSGDHAEYTLLERKLPDEVLAGATLFTTLEPCTTRNDPKIPCAQRIIDRRFRRVVIGTLDPNVDICGRGELTLRGAGIEVARFDPDLMAELEELNRDFIRDQQRRGIERSTRQNADPASNEVGPNGHRVVYNERGDKIELVPEDDAPGGVMELLLRRNDQSIVDTYNELWNKVWWNRHQVRHDRNGEDGCPVPGQDDREDLIGCEAARRIEHEYGRANLGWDDFEWGLLSGRMSALSWVLGSEWNESLDT